MRRIRGGPPLRDRLRADRIRAHEPSHTVLTDPLALGLKSRVDPGTAVDPSRRGVDAPNLGNQPSILCRAATLGLGHPSIVPRG
jgi:hypothetical protein